MSRLAGETYDRLHAPWRGDYVSTPKKKNRDCVFCVKRPYTGSPRPDLSKASLVSILSDDIEQNSSSLAVNQTDSDLPNSAYPEFLSSEELQQYDKERLILYRGEYCYAILNLYPYANGHTMVLPYRHLSDYQKLSTDEIIESYRITKLCCKAMQQGLSAHGFNIGYNVGSIAGAGIADHLHQHIVPRWPGDNNFMPAIAETRVIAEHMEVTYNKLLEQISQLSIDKV